MSKLKRSRALRRNLRKQARKGTLSARERKTLLQQEKRFRKARRPFMRGLGFGAGLGAGALLVPGVGGLISGLGGLRPGKDDPENERPEDMEEFGGDMIQAGEIKTGAPEDRGLIGDIQVVGEAPDEAMRAVGEELEGEEGEEEGGEAPADEFVETDRPADAPEPHLGRQRPPASEMPEQVLLGDIQDLDDTPLEAMREIGASDFPEPMSRRPARPIPLDIPDPRVGSRFDPLLEDPGILRALRGFGRRGGRRSGSFAEGGRVDKSNDLVARIKRKYGLR